jgi:multiple sugar transport system permease protein/N,N'-diacetylchitobiose transport system permease protein
MQRFTNSPGQALRDEGRFAWFLLAPAMVLLAAVVVAPLAITFSYSFQNKELLSSHNGEFVGLGNYFTILTSGWFWDSFLRTLYFTVVSLTLEVGLGLAVALLLNQQFRGVAILRALVILPWAIPTNVSAALWRWIYHPEYGVLNALLTNFHLIDSYKTWLSDPFLAMNMVILADVWKMTPLAVIFFLASLQFINKALYEAAALDGMGALRRFWFITLPFLMPTMAVVVVMRTMEKFKAFDLFYVMTRGGPANGTMVLTYEAYLRGFTNLEYSTAATLAYLIGFVILALTLVYMRVLKAQEGIQE